MTGGPPPGLDWDLWLGPAAKMPYEEVMNGGRQRYWEFYGGNLTEWGAHLADIVLWAMKVTGPETVVAAGGRFHRGRGRDPRHPAGHATSTPSSCFTTRSSTTTPTA